MIVSGLRRMWRSDRPVRTAVSPRGCVVIIPLLGEGQEDVFQARLLLDVLDLRRGKQLLELGQGAVDDDASLVKDRYPVGEMLGLVQVLRREEYGCAGPGELGDGIPHLQTRLRARVSESYGSWSAISFASSAYCSRHASAIAGSWTARLSKASATMHCAVLRPAAGTRT